ncbi:hypothetical protein COOONC_22959 [Cooperia oncophora]
MTPLWTMKILVLSKRPLAYEIFKSGKRNEQLSSDLGLRLEIYRCLQMAGSPNEFFKFMLNFAVEDLECCRAERDIACILDVLCINRQFLDSKEQELVALVRHKIAGEWRMPETIAMAYRLLVFVSTEEAPSSDMRVFLRVNVYIYLTV